MDLACRLAEIEDLVDCLNGADDLIYCLIGAYYLARASLGEVIALRAQQQTTFLGDLLGLAGLSKEV
jgi:hypothetical protein